MSELAVPNKTELESYNQIARIAASNPFWRKLGGGGDQETIVGTILSVILLGRELGLPPMFCVSGAINNIQGKFELSARAMNMLIRKHGHQLKIKLQNEKACTVWGKRKDTGEEAECSYTIEEAARANLIKEGRGAWSTVPSDMLFARALSRLARRLFADCLGGCYVEGELQETVLKQPIDTIDVPSADEFNSDIVVKPVIELQLPPDINADRVELFIEQSARANNVTVDIMKSRAAKNPDFINIYRSWEAKQTVA